MYTSNYKANKKLQCLNQTIVSGNFLTKVKSQPNDVVSLNLSIYIKQIQAKTNL